MTREFSDETFVERHALSFFVVLVVAVAIVFAYRTVVPTLHTLLGIA